MKVELGEVLSRAWQITWKHKVLWVYGAVIGLVVSFMFPLMLVPMSLPFLIENSRTNITFMPVVMGGFVVVFIGLMLLLYPISVLMQTSLTFGILDVEHGEGKLPIVDAFKKGLPYFWRILGLMLLFAVGMMLFQAVIQGVLLLGSTITLGFGLICLAPLMILMYPVIYLVIVWMEQGMNSILIGQFGIIDAIRHGWTLLRENLLLFGLTVLVIYFGIGMISAVAIMPLMIPMFLLPFSYMGREPNWVILFIGILGTVISMPIFALLTGWAMAFSKSAWVLIYLRLTSSSGLPQIELQEAVS